VNAVKEIVANGVETSSGSGHTLPVPRLTAKALEHIITLVPPRAGFLESHYIQDALGWEVQKVQEDYCKFAAKASLNYHLKDDVTAMSMGIDNRHLQDDATSVWRKNEYEVKEFKVLRETGVNRRKLIKSFRSLAHSLCVSERIMLEIQYAWLDASLPQSWWESMHRTYMKSPYDHMRFTDVNQEQFRLQLPMQLDDFVSHIDDHGKDVREGLVEFWLVSVGMKLSAAVEALPPVVTNAAGGAHSHSDGVGSLERMNSVNSMDDDVIATQMTEETDPGSEAGMTK
jgi:hypothetical protein